jgi:hypothetical protein
MNAKVIVSLTSYPYRFKKPDMINCLKSLVNQETDIPYKIVFNIFEGDIKEIPSELVLFVKKNNIELYHCPLDLRSHKKYFYVMQKYKNLPIITVDDDIIYSKHLVSDLYKSYMKFSKCVSACYLYRMAFDKNDKLIAAFNKWNIKYEKYEPSFRNSFGSGGGTLFPPGCLNISDKLMPQIEEYITDDELLLKKWLNDAGIPVVKCKYEWNDEKHDTISRCGSYLKAAEYARDDNSLWRSGNNVNMNKHIKELLWPYDYKKLDDSFKPSIIVTMTSWKNRIGEVIKTLESCNDQTVKPDRIYLNLSVSEFPGKNNDIPEEIVNYAKNHKNFTINWVEGPNTKPFKKVFPILKFCKYNDIIILVDDDMILPKDFVESRVSDFKKYNQPITSAISTDDVLSCKKINAGSLFTKKMLWNWERLFVDKVLETHNDDRTYLYILYLNGYIPRTATKYDVRSITNEMANKNTSNRLKSVAQTFKYGKDYDNYVNDVIVGITGKPIQNSFGYFSDGVGKSLKSENGVSPVSENTTKQKPKKSNIRKLRDDIASGRVIQIPTIGGFIWKRVK